jgi:branched-chain amino acid transport system permease protein
LRNNDRLLAAACYFWEPAVLAVSLLVIALLVAATGSEVLRFTVTNGLIQAVLVIGLYIFIGNSGILAFGHITYAMIGAYAAAWLTMSPFKKSFALALPNFLADNSFPLFPSSIAAALLAGIVALITGIPLTRLGGISASIGTFTVLVIFNTIYSNWDSWTFGASTLVGIPTYVNEWVALGWTTVALVAATVHQKSRFGLALRASRENEVAARATGINVPLQRLIAFALSGLFMGVGGVLQAHFLGTIAVTGFWISSTFIALAMLIIGGQRSLTGAVVGTIVVSTLLEVLRQFEVGIHVANATLQMPRGLRELGIALLMLIILTIRNAGLTGGREIPWPFTRLGASRTGGAAPAADAPLPGSSLAERIGAAGGDMTLTLEARNVSVYFGGLPAIAGVTFCMRRDEVFGLIGPNGAGKTTMVNVLTGFQKPSEGTVVLAGMDVTGREPHVLGRMGLARTFQAVRLFRDMTVLENLEVAAVGAGLTRKEAVLRSDGILEWMHFEKKAYARADTLPYGDERRVGIARALATSPRFAFLDEPAAGMSDAECDDLMSLISQIPGRFGCGVLLIEHNMRVIMGVCHRIHVIDSGRTIVEGEPERIQNNPDVIRAYLGSKSDKSHA